MTEILGYINIVLIYLSLVYVTVWHCVSMIVFLTRLVTYLCIYLWLFSTFFIFYLASRSLIEMCRYQDVG